MNTAVPISHKVQRILIAIEWLLLVEAAFDNLSSVDFSFLPGAYWRLFFLIVTMGVLIRHFPVHRSLSQRRAYIITQIIVLFLAQLVRLNTSLLFDMAIIKACLLLPYKEVILVVVASVFVRLAHFSWILPTLKEELISRTDLYLNDPNIVIEAAISMGTSAAFVVLLGFIFAAGQRNRHRAERLAVEVEALATKLERARIARDIHDSLGHSLTTLDIQLALAERYNNLPNSSSAENRAKLQTSLSKAKQLAAQCLAEARQSLQTMRQSNFDLPTALRTLAEQMRPSFVVNLQVQLPLLSQQLNYQLYLIAKEGLVNVQKHAQATKVTLSAIAIQDNIVLKLLDNGCGFDVDCEVSGYGLQGIRERSHLLGGKMNIYSSPQGSTIEVTVPAIQPAVKS